MLHVLAAWTATTRTSTVRPYGAFRWRKSNLDAQVAPRGNLSGEETRLT